MYCIYTVYSHCNSVTVAILPITVTVTVMSRIAIQSDRVRKIESGNEWRIGIGKKIGIRKKIGIVIANP